MIMQAKRMLFVVVAIALQKKTKTKIKHSSNRYDLLYVCKIQFMDTYSPFDYLYENKSWLIIIIWFDTKA